LPQVPYRAKKLAAHCINATTRNVKRTTLDALYASEMGKRVRGAQSEEEVAAARNGNAGASPAL
jgi:hypothetical protein